jgi:hypothetical protein
MMLGVYANGQSAQKRLNAVIEEHRRSTWRMMSMPGDPYVQRWSTTAGEVITRLEIEKVEVQE